MSIKNEDEWYRKFQNGTLLIKGWKARIKEILKEMPEDRQDALRVELEQLGEKIGREWAKDDKIRKIDTLQLQRWGNELKAAKRQGPEALEVKLREIGEDVHQRIS